MKDKKIAVAMSGGVDSSVAAYILKKQGYDVFGITMTVIPKYVCKGKERSDMIIRDARAAAEKIGIDHHVIDLREVFEQRVVKYFAEEYKSGRTPNPCVACNRHIKFGELFDAAKSLGADYVVTGHYARIEEDPETGRFLLKKPVDSSKDQTYFLYNVRKEYLSQVLMPLKDLTKDQVRELAKEIDIDVSEKPDSEEICFIPNEDHGRFIEEDLKEELVPGDFVDEEGNVLGRHKGIVHYTIGQRKGLGIALGKRVYVVDIIPENNQVVLGDEKDIFQSKLYARDVNLLAIDELPSQLRAMAKIRSTSKEAEVLVKPYEDGMLVQFKEEQRAITKGQSIVLYDGDIVIGGGIVDRVY